jgi:hypothetical protein
LSSSFSLPVDPSPNVHTVSSKAYGNNFTNDRTNPTQKRILSPTALSIASAGPPDGSAARRTLISTASYRWERSAQTDDTIEIPEFLEIKETLEFLGFRQDVAANLVKRFEEDLIDILWAVGSFNKYIIGWIDSADVNAWNEAEDWNAALWSAGLKPAYITSIMDPEFTELRRTESALCWALDTVRMG